MHLVMNVIDIVGGGGFVVLVLLGDQRDGKHKKRKSFLLKHEVLSNLVWVSFP